MADIIKIQNEMDGSLEKRLEPTITSRANPTPDWLLEARAAINRRQDLQDFVKRGKDDGVPNEALADGLAVMIDTGGFGDNHSEDIFEAALYLMDEYDQLPEGIHIVSTETGKVVITLTEDDLWDPGMVPREGGGMAQAQRRIRPDIEAAITSWTFDRNREEAAVRALAAKGHQTPLLRDLGDTRLRIATRRGRTQMVRDLAGSSSLDLLRRCGGTTGSFLRYLVMQTIEPEGDGWTVLSGTLEASSTMNISDPVTTNLHYNRAHALRGVMAQEWTRNLARVISDDAHDRLAEGIRSVQLEDLKNEDLIQCRYWIVPPEAMSHLRQISGDLAFIPVDGAPFTGLYKSKVGFLVIPDQFGAGTTEMFDKWTVEGRLEFKLFLDPEALCVLDVQGIPYQAQVTSK